MTYLLITMGGIVCVTESGRGCPDWPGCYGKIFPPLKMDAIIEYTHRLVAALTTPFVVAAAVVGWRRYRSIRWVSWPSVIAMVCLFAVIGFGAQAVLNGLPPVIAAVDVGSALMVQALTLVTTVVAFSRRANPNWPARLSFDRPLARLALGALVGVFVVLVSGVLVAGNQSTARCLGWPLYGGRWALVDLRHWLQMTRRLIAGLASVLIVAVIVQAWRRRQGRGLIRRVATAVGVLFLIETFVGMLVSARGFGDFFSVAYVATAAALWALLVVLVVLVGNGAHQGARP